VRAVVFVLLSASFASAQSFQGTLRGRILDPKGAAASAVAITLTDEGGVAPMLDKSSKI